MPAACYDLKIKKEGGKLLERQCQSILVSILLLTSCGYGLSADIHIGARTKNNQPKMQIIKREL
jgi:hypothetical protein